MQTINQKFVHNMVLPSLISMDQFVTWTNREVKAVNPLAIAAWPIAQIAKVINQLILSLFTSAIFKDPEATETLKIRAAVILASRREYTDMLEHIPGNLIESIDKDIYDQALAENGSNGTHDVSDPLFGQHFREANPTDFRVTDAINNVLKNL